MRGDARATIMPLSGGGANSDRAVPWKEQRQGPRPGNEPGGGPLRGHRGGAGSWASPARILDSPVSGRRAPQIEGCRPSSEPASKEQPRDEDQEP
jgi:hypothetical protein